MKTLKFYFQTTLETIIVLIFMWVAVAIVDFAAEPPKPRHPTTLDLKLVPGAYEFARFREFGWDKKPGEKK